MLRSSSVRTGEPLKASTMATPPPAIPNAVRDLGRKARARLQEEQTKRHGVQRCEETHPTASPKRGILLLKPPKKKRRSSSLQRRKSPQTNQPQEVDDMIDRWMPDVSSLIDFHQDQGKKSSSLIQLHGVPTDTTPSMIRRFLAGLEPFSLWFLAFPLNFLPALDAKDDNGSWTVERIQRPFRLLVRLTHANVAQLAVERSGECMDDRAAVAVTRIANQTLAHALLDRLAVPWFDNETTLQQAGEELMAQLDPQVPDILWTDAEKEIRGLLGPHDQEKSSFSVPSLLSKKKRYSVAETQQLREQRELLQNEIKRLRQQLPIVAHDASICDPVSTFTQSSIAILERDVAQIQHALLISDKWAYLQTMAGKCVTTHDAEN